MAWAWIVAYAAAMPARMGAGMAPQPGVGAFLGVWMCMMAAMMLPAVAPVATIYVRTIGAGPPGLPDAGPAPAGSRPAGSRPAGVRPGGVRPAGALPAGRAVGLVVGYLLVWAAYGIIAFAATRAFGVLSGPSGSAAPWIDAAALAVAGVYQFTPAKNRCLSHCRSPLAVLLHVGNFRGPLRDVRAGFWHGGYCLGCCWSLMLVLVAVGMMNIVWMVLLAGVVFVEKTWRYGRQFSYAVGGLLLILAIAVPLQPALVGVAGM